MISWDWTIRAGDVLTMCGALIVAAGIIYNRGRAESRLEGAVLKSTEELSGLKGEVSDLRGEMKQFGTIMAKMAVQETKIDLLMKWYDELRRGIGLVRSPLDDQRD